MSFKQVQELRKGGKLDEALNLAKQDLEAGPDDIWNKRSIAWVYYEYLKQSSEPEKYDQFKEYLDKIKGLSLPEEEKMVFDNIAYQVGKLIFEFNKELKNTNKKIDIDEFRLLEILEEILSLITDFHFTKPSQAYSFLFKAFHKGYYKSSKYVWFMDCWGFENFMPEDFLPEEFNNKKTISIVEQSYIAYAKNLLEGKLIENLGFVKGINKEGINNFIPKLDELIKTHPEYQYPPYYKAKLLLATGDTEDVLSSFIPFAMSKKNDFWVWELMSDVFPENDERKLACLCKALSLNTPDTFTINTRQKLANLLIKTQKYNEAKTEIARIINVRNENNWRIPIEIQNSTKEKWFSEAAQKQNNAEFYKQRSPIAEEILFRDIPEEIVAVEFVNRNKKILNFVKDKNFHGFFNYSGMPGKPEVGDILKVRFKEKKKDTLVNALTIKKAGPDTPCEAISEFEGNIRIKESANFGFVDDIFIDPNLVKQNNLQNEQRVEGKAIISFNKKRNEWGWKAINL